MKVAECRDSAVGIFINSQVAINSQPLMLRDVWNVRSDNRDTFRLRRADDELSDWESVVKAGEPERCAGLGSSRRVLATLGFRYSL